MNTTLNRILLLFFISLSSLFISAQTFHVKGTIVDNNQERLPVIHANVVLETSGSNTIKGTVSKNDGTFLIDQIKPGDYNLKISCIGYLDHITVLENISCHIDLGEIVLFEDNQQLNEVTVVASRTIEKVDRQVVFPTQAQIKSSNNGYELLGGMMLPRLRIDEKQNSISTVEGGSVQIRINDIKVTSLEMLALQPDEVIRVEYIDNPGVRYGDDGANAVINFIVKRKSAGISGGVNLTNALTTGFGNDNIYIKANYKRSEFGLNYNMNYRDYSKRKIDETQEFLLPDKSVRMLEREGVNADFSYTAHDIALSYNLIEPDKYVFNAVFRNSIYDSPHRGYKQIIREDGKPDIVSSNEPTDKSSTPSLDLYYQRELPKKQSLILNIVGTYIGTDYTYGYNEYDLNNSMISQYSYSTDGKRYSLIGEGIYEKEFQKVKLSSGVQYTQGYTKNEYVGDENTATRMHNSNIYVYTQIQGTWKKINYMLGVGINKQSFDQNDKGFDFYTFRPSVSLSYPIFQGATLRYNFNIIPTLPSLSGLSDVRQQKNDYEINVGNPQLKPYRSYLNQLSFSYRYKRFNMQLSGSYTYRDKPIMGEVWRVEDNGNYIYEYHTDNQRSLQQFFGQLYMRYELIKDILTASGNVGVSDYNSKGNNYSHDYTSYFGGGNILLTLKNWSVSGAVNSRYKSLFGEDIRFGEWYSNVDVRYKLKDFRFGVGMMYPLSSEGWSAGSRSVSPLARRESWTYIKDNGNMLTLSFSWNFNYGRKFETKNKRLNNMDNESGILK